MLKNTVIVMLLLTLLIPTFSISQNAQNAIQEKAIRDAINDVELLDKEGWYLVGCFFNIGALAAVVMYDPPVPAKRFVGMPPDYISYYTAAYVNTAKKENMKNAFVGCLLGGCIQIAIIYARYDYLYN